MFKQIFVVVMISVMTIVQAQAVTGNGLKAAFDELNYALTVEWDQKDKKFHNEQLDAFKIRISELQEEGLTNQELIDFALSQVKSEQLSKDLQTAFTMIAINQMSSQEARRYVSDIIYQSYSQGASWAGEVIVGVLVIVILVAVAAIVAGKARVGNGCYEVYTCDEYCTGGVCYDDCYWKCII